MATEHGARPIKTQRIILAGPKTIFRAGAARVLSLEKDMEVVAQCHEPARVRAAVESLRPSTVLLSFALLSKHSELLIPMKRARSGVVLTAQVSDHVPLDIQNQVDARIPLNIAPEDLVTCVRHVAQGHRFVRGEHLPVTFEADPDGARVRDCLTPKEIQVVALITRACKNKEIAERLGTCEGSIKNHLSNIFEKTGLCDRLELAVFALHHPSLADAASIAAGLLRVPEPSAPSSPASPRRGKRGRGELLEAIQESHKAVLGRCAHKFHSEGAWVPRHTIDLDGSRVCPLFEIPTGGL